MGIRTFYILQLCQHLAKVGTFCRKERLSLKMTRGLKFRIWKVEGLYYLCSENKGAGQLHGNREADMHLCFSHMQNVGFTHYSAQM